jgi:hypothetical protein
MASSGMTYISSFMKTGTGIEAILRFVAQQFQTLQCWYFWDLTMYTVEMGSGATIYTPSFIKTGFKHSRLVRGGYTHMHAPTHRQQSHCIHLLLFFIISEVS